MYLLHSVNVLSILLVLLLLIIKFIANIVTNSVVAAKSSSFIFLNLILRRFKLQQLEQCNLISEGIPSIYHISLNIIFIMSQLMLTSIETETDIS